MSCEEYFAQQLRDRGYRLTPQREAVLSVLHELHGLVTAEELYDLVQSRSEHLDLSTVYRTLDLLVDLTLVAVVDTGEGQRRYELVGPHGQHHHLHCTACGAVVPVADEALKPLVDHLIATYGFTAQPASLTIEGLCAACLDIQRSQDIRDPL